MSDWLHASFGAWVTRVLVVVFGATSIPCLLIAWEMWRRRDNRAFAMLWPIFLCRGLLDLAHLVRFHKIPLAVDLSVVPPLMWYNIAVTFIMSVMLWRLWFFIRGRID